MAAILVFDGGGQLSGDRIDVYEAAIAEGKPHGEAFWIAAGTPIHRDITTPPVVIAERPAPVEMHEKLKLSRWERFKALLGL